MNQRTQFAETVTRLMGENEKIVLLLADVGTYGFREAFKRWPNRCLNTGPAEAATVGIAAGFAKEGFYPVVHSFSSFLCRRAYEQVYLDFGAQGLRGLFVGIHGYEKFGASHICGEDQELMRNVPHMWVWTPTSGGNVDVCLRLSVEENNLAYVRLS